MYNSVDDPAYDDITNRSTFSVKVIGPLKQNEVFIDMSSGSPKVYCSVCDQLQVDTIEFEYDDKTTDVIDFHSCWEMVDVDEEYKKIKESRL